MQRTKHRALRDEAHVWRVRAWHFQTVSDFECCDQSRQLALYADGVADAYEGAARFEMAEDEAMERAKGLAHAYGRALAKLDGEAREWAQRLSSKRM